MDNITSPIQKFATKVVHIQTIDSANAGDIPLEEAMFANRMTVTELLDSDWSWNIEVSDLIYLTTLSTLQKIKTPLFKIKLTSLYICKECMVTLRAQITEIDTYFD